MAEKRIQVYGTIAGQPGKDGKDGKDGVDGKDGGYYKPSLQDGILIFTPSNSNMPPIGSVGNIKGKDGIDGVDGKDGYTPIKDVDYFDGESGGYYIPSLDANGTLAFSPSKSDMLEIGNLGNIKGKDGANGKSAFAFAQEGGYTGTESEFAAKLASPYEFAFNVELNEQSEGVADVTAQALINALASGVPIVCWADFDNSGVPFRLPFLAMPEDGVFLFLAHAGDSAAMVQAVIVDDYVVAYGAVTSNDITIGDASWYGGSFDFTDAVNKLITDKLPTKTSQLTNDSNFITKAVSDLTNYYTKSNTYTKTEVNELVSAIPKFSIAVVSALPTSNISNTTIYLVSGGEGSNLYTEYIYVNNKWEILGSQEVDLTGYAKTTDIPTSLKNPKALTFTGAATGSYDGSSAKTINIPTAPTKTSQLTNDSGYAVVAEVEAVNTKVKQKGVHYIVGNSTTAGVWTGTCNDITAYFDGLTIAYRTNIAGVSGGTTLNINNLGAIAVRRNAAAVTTHYGVNSLLHLTYTTIDGVGFWQMADYDSNTKTSAGTSNKTGTKMYLVGGTSQSSSGVTTYSNKNVYIGTDNCLYSNGQKTMVIVDPQIYGAKGDGSTDDTTAFTNALANNRKVYVPGGTYKLTSGIVIRDNCELELAQDAVLNFTQTSGNCITLNMSSSLKGNHATINVPYAFSGNVIYADTATTTDVNTVPPFAKWSPQWKSGRYITDINICKADSRGFHYSVNGDTNGTAVYLSADGNKTLTYMWGVNYSGLRIAGGFKYGIRAVNFNDGWNHEMRIEAFIDACEIGVSLEKCNNAYISAAIQPRRAYTTAEVYLPYAKHGIELINSRNIDLSGSRVWDWNATNTLWTNGGEYQHIALKGNCSGLILNDFLYYEQSTIDIRDLIYTDTASNLEKITILQEPFTRWFKPIEGEPYFYNGLDNKKILIEGDLDPYFQTDAIKNYTDVLATATDASGNIFNGIGYQRGVRFTSLGTGTDVTTSAYYMVTGYIPVKPGTTIYTKDLRFSDITQTYAGIVYYNSSRAHFASMNITHVVNGNADFVTNYTETADGCSFVIPNKATLTNQDMAYVRFCFPISGVGTNPSISLNEPISETVAGFLADNVKVKAANIVGSFNEYQQVSNKVTSLSASSTDAQYPSAKAVYTALQSALGEYVTDIASLVGGGA